MKNIKLVLLYSLALSLLALPCQAVVIGAYPGLDKLIDQSDAIVVVRIDDAFAASGANGWMNHKCLVYQTLKGDLKPGTQATLFLNEFVGPRLNFGQPLAPMTNHLLFLKHFEPSFRGANYSAITDDGADLPLSPLGNETKPEGKTLKLQIQTLIRHYQTYRDAELKREDALLQRALSE